VAVVSGEVGRVADIPPGHRMFEVESRGETLLLWGDIVHVAAVQFADPTVMIAYDVDN
jgi:hypothetical protein